MVNFIWLNVNDTLLTSLEGGVISPFEGIAVSLRKNIPWHERTWPLHNSIMFLYSLVWSITLCLSAFVATFFWPQRHQGAKNLPQKCCATAMDARAINYFEDVPVVEVNKICKSRNIIPIGHPLTYQRQ